MQTQHWNDVADTTICTTPLDINMFERYVIDQHARILDVGCGYGRTLAELADAGYDNLIGIDLSEGMVARGLREHPELDLRVCGIEDMENASADVILLFGVLTAVPFDEDQSHLISEAERVLSPSGLLFVEDFTLNGDMRNMDRYADYFEDVPDGAPYGSFMLDDGTVLRHHRIDYLRELLSCFKMCEERIEKFPTVGGHTSNGMVYVGRKR